jgi:hypothetical protein
MTSTSPDGPWTLEAVRHKSSVSAAAAKIAVGGAKMPETDGRPEGFFSPNDVRFPPQYRRDLRYREMS